jgi:hypothetical protein
MDPAAIQKIVDDEISDDWSRSNLHGVDLRACLVTPSLQIFRSHPQNTPPWELWVVLEEDPVGLSGYKVAYDADSGTFCVAYGKQPNASYVGHYGSFLETLDAM